ncbi:hypothetical protein AY601_1950 [Pedobacter cryoconitis]|uniref:Uncharacterized protein n=1 Tax=Pedobacter cryoconitis TaxID=188932 RepID=A0A127VBY3_9SPHI|nr:hypothetical protein [Pedobacter cryoconitis]AMP98856.1 hypothetical protein AY601_1950 [Pedobacter cryoconitis]
MNKVKDRIRIFNSFEEAKKSEIQNIINQSPIDRLRQTVELILRVHQVSREDLKNRTATGKIRIITSG